jgi:hypothetical protein
VKNMGTADRVIRLLIVVAIGAAYLLGYLSGIIAIMLVLIAVVFLLTSLFATCPAYMPLGLSTRKARS